MKKETENKLTDLEKLVKIAEIVGIDPPGNEYEDLDDQYDQFLDDCSGGETVILGCTVIPSKHLKDNDPIAYRCGKNDWLDGRTSDGELIEIGDHYSTEEELEEFRDNIVSEIEDLDLN
jgi:hypothetical protein